MNKSDLKLIIISIIILSLSFGLIYLFKNNNAKTAIIYYENNVVKKIDLNTDGEYTVDGYNGKVILEVKNNKMRVVEEKSPKHLCSYQGFISETYQTIVCLPNKIIVKIDSKEEYDAIVR